jgi:hypothetical protein
VVGVVAQFVEVLVDIEAGEQAAQSRRARPHAKVIIGNSLPIGPGV